MTRTAVLAWLESRRPAPPAPLREHLAGAVTAADASLPEHLATIGGALLRRLTEAAGGRELALDLLAADAFVTYAFEAQAEQDVFGLDALADRVGRVVETR